MGTERWNTFKKFIFLYPLVFLVVLGMFAVARNFSVPTSSNGYVEIEEENVPMGPVEEPTPMPLKMVQVGETEYKLIYEKATNVYLVYSGFQCLGYIQLKPEETIENITPDNVESYIQHYK